jgi:hypothetical protein
LPALDAAFFYLVDEVLVPGEEEVGQPTQDRLDGGGPLILQITRARCRKAAGTKGTEDLVEVASS